MNSKKKSGVISDWDNILVYGMIHLMETLVTSRVTVIDTLNPRDNSLDNLQFSIRERALGAPQAPTVEPKTEPKKAPSTTPAPQEPVTQPFTPPNPNRPCWVPDTDPNKTFPACSRDN